MTISSLTQVYSNLSSSLSGASNGTAISNSGTTSIGDQLLASIGTLPATAQQDLVSLSSLSSNQNNPLPQTYNAQGLLQQIQTSLLNNDQLLMSGSSGSAGSSISDSLLQGLLSTSQTSSLPNVSSQNSQSSNASNSVNLNANWSTVLKQNPSMAATLVQSQIDQSLLSIFDQ